MCEWTYLRDVALPSLKDGAKSAGREPPPLIAHVSVCLSEDRDVVRQTAREQVGRYSQFPPYQAMFAAAGYGDVSAGFTDQLIDNLVVSGTEREIRARLDQILAEGAGELLIHPLLLGSDRIEYLGRLYDMLAVAQAGLQPAQRRET
jgi:alkanesulfonate monooxygenase SsuD/methylene tetrahydromethanopterin reductase-like flavin-dependent oxidoreductase (luciferase family)